MKNIQTIIHTAPITFFILIINLLILVYNHATATIIVSVPGVFNAQSIAANFSHYELLHFGFNMALCWQISPLIEQKIKSIPYALFIASTTILITIGVPFFSSHPTLGFSGIALALMVFGAGIFYQNKVLSTQLFGWAMLNVFMGIVPGISFAGHFVGALAGGILFLAWYVLKKYKL